MERGVFRWTISVNKERKRDYIEGVFLVTESVDAIPALCHGSQRIRITILYILRASFYKLIDDLFVFCIFGFLFFYQLVSYLAILFFYLVQIVDCLHKVFFTFLYGF